MADQRIESLLRVKPVRTVLDAGGTVGHGRQLQYDQQASLDEKALRLAYHYGAAWAKSVQDEDARVRDIERLARFVLTEFEPEFMFPDGNRVHGFYAREQTRFARYGIEGDSFRAEAYPPMVSYRPIEPKAVNGYGPDEWAWRMVAACRHRSRSDVCKSLGKPFGVLTMTAGEELAGRMPGVRIDYPMVILSHRVNVLPRSFLGKRQRWLGPRDYSNGHRIPLVTRHEQDDMRMNVEWHAFTSKAVEDMRSRGLACPKLVGLVDVEFLVGYGRLIETVYDDYGVDLRSCRPGRPLDMEAARHRDRSYEQWQEAVEPQVREVRELIGRAHRALDEIAMSELAGFRQEQRYRELAHGKVAGAYEDKIVVSKKVAARAASSSLHREFAIVEFDEDIDLDKVPQLEREILEAMRWLPRPQRSEEDMQPRETYSMEEGRMVMSVPQPPELASLRVRKLGKYGSDTKLVSGVYFPAFRTIVLDDGAASRAGVSGMASFIHEYGHYLDDQWLPWRSLSTPGPNPEGPSFERVLDAVCRDLTLHAKEFPNQSFVDYLKVPTEVFARCFEYYVGHVLGSRSSLLAREEEYERDPRFFGIREHEEEVAQYMAARFPSLQRFDTLDIPQETPERPGRARVEGMQIPDALFAMASGSCQGMFDFTTATA